MSEAVHFYNVSVLEYLALGCPAPRIRLRHWPFYGDQPRWLASLSSPVPLVAALFEIRPTVSVLWVHDSMLVRRYRMYLQFYRHLFPLFLTFLVHF